MTSAIDPPAPLHATETAIALGHLKRGWYGRRMSNLTTLSAIELSKTIASGDASCVEVMDAFLEKIEAANQHVNALVNLIPRDECLNLAREADAAPSIAAGPEWLHGIPVAVKDLSRVKGLATTFGSRLFQDEIATYDDPHVAHLRAAGAIIIGKTNVPEWGLGGHTDNPVFGLTRNAHDYQLSAGGSSGGAASALASGMLSIADGSDMMGSLRTPAAFQGLVGFRPTPGVVPLAPEMDSMELGLFSIGPMARNVADASALFTTLSGRAPQTSAPNPLELSLAGLKIGWLGSAGGHWPIEPSILRYCEQALTVLATAGAKVDACTSHQIPDLWPCWLALRQTALSPGKTLYQDPSKRPLMSNNWQWEIEQGALLRRDDIGAAKQTQRAWQAELGEIFSQYDMLIAPTCQVHPFASAEGIPHQIHGRSLDTYHRWLEVSLPASLGNLPVISMPIPGLLPQHMTGLQLMMPPGSDQALLSVAQDVETVLGRVI